MRECEYDVLIIGGGPAGSTAAAVARQKGLSVYLAEKEDFPRFRIGESLLPYGNNLLKEIGVWSKIEQAGFIKKMGAAFFVAGCDAEKEVIFSNGLIPGLNYTYQVERSKFDAILLDHAEEMGAVVARRTKVDSIEESTDSCVARISDANGARMLRTRWVLDASGRDNSLKCELKKKMDPPRLQKRIAVYSHFIGVPRRTDYAAGHTIVVRLESGWFWIIPIDATRTSVGLVIETESYKKLKGSPEDVFWKAVRSAPQLDERMRGATATQPFHVTSDYSYFRQQLASSRVVLVGDAAGFFDPIFSSGVYVGSRSAKLAAELISKADRAGRGLTPEEQQDYTSDVKSHARVFEKLIKAFYDNDSFAVFMSATPPASIERAINSIVAGHATMTFSLRWRFTLFRLICWLQKRFKIETPVPLAPLPTS